MAFSPVQTRPAVTVILGAWLFFLATLVPVAPVAAPVEIINQSSSDVLNILVTPLSEQKPVFIRLDLAPGAGDQVENPAVRANLRIDTGLAMWRFPDVNLPAATRLTLSGSAEPRLLLENANGVTFQLEGRSESLVPASGDKPVCELGQFHPGMPMKDVCSILEPNLLTDDNGAMLTGLGFAGLVWAARLAPELDGSVTEDSRLQHLELRRPLEPDSPGKTLSRLYQQGYVPWEAEFPNQDVDFNGEDSDADTMKLHELVNSFLSHTSKEIASNPQDTEAEAVIMLVPAAMRSEVANADEPARDVQLFTLFLKPQSNTLLVDVAAYKGTRQQ